MDHNNKKWEKRPLGLLGCLAGLAITMISGGAFMSRHEIKTLGTLGKIDDNAFYSMRCDGDYGLDDFLGTGASMGGELVRFATERLLKGLSFEFSTPGPGCSVSNAWTKEGDHTFGRSFDLIYSLTLIVKTAPDHGYRSLSTVNLALLGLGESNLPDSPKEKLIALATPYAPLDGISKKGLAAAVLYIADEPTNWGTGKTGITTITATQLMLDKTATVDEAVELLEQYDMHPPAGSYYHFQIADAGGNSTMVEYADNELVVLKAEQDYQMATNFLLSDKECNFGSGQDRYEMLETSLDSCSGVVEDEQVGMDLLQTASKNWHVPESSGRMNAARRPVTFDCTDLTAKIITGHQYDEPAYEFSPDQ